MPVYTARMTANFEVLQGDQWALGGRTVAYHVGNARLVGADRYNAQTFILSAGLSAQAIPIAPLGVSAPGILIYLTADRPIDVRTNSPGDTAFLSGIQLLQLAGHVSNLYVSTNDADTTIHLEVAGGSAASLQTSFPLP